MGRWMPCATACSHVSVATTTGFSTTDYLAWPVFIPVLLLLLSGVATSAGSTGGGIKMVRMLILVKQARREMTRLVHPRAVQPVRLGDAVVDNPMIFRCWPTCWFTVPPSLC
jgi:trk system potassium uptake protein TrkH